MVENFSPGGTMLCVVRDGADIQGKFLIVKHLRLAKIHRNHESFPT